MKLSIIIVNYNTYKFLDKCLSSIRKYGGLDPKDYEIFVVDNFSSDGSVNKIVKDHREVNLIQNKSNTGFAKANNLAIKKSKGKYVLILNPDTVITYNSLKILLDFISREKKPGIVSPKLELPDGTIDDACHRGFPSPWNAFCHFSGLSKLFPSSLRFNGYHLGYKNLRSIHEIDSCSGAFMLVDRAAGAKLGWFDEDYFWYGEDLDFCYRMKEINRKIIFNPDVTVIHYKGVSSGIKKHSQSISEADNATRLTATKARFDVMRIFYRKHYISKYPFFVRHLILAGIKIKEIIALNKYKLN